MDREKTILSAKNALDAVAKKHGISVETVQHDIEAAMTAAQKNMPPKARAFWKSVPHKGDIPTPEEVIASLADILKLR